MPITAPSSHTDFTLAAFLGDELGAVGRDLGWAGADDWAPVIRRTLRLLGLASVTAATDVTALEALALREACRACARDLGLRYDFRDETESYSRSQQIKAFMSVWQRAENDALTHDPAYAVTRNRIARPQDWTELGYLPQERVL